MDAKVRYPSDVVVETVAQYPDKFDLYYQSEDGNIRLYLVLP
jgi:hypothetical protein